MKYFKTAGIVLKNQGADAKTNFVTAYTRHFGKVVYLAKGLQKIEARLKSPLEQFNYSEIISVKGHLRPIVTRATLIKTFWHQDQDFSSKILLFYFTDLLDRLVEEGAQDKKLFSLLLKALEALQEKKQANAKFLSFIGLFLIYFPFNALNILGLTPEIYRCALCQKKLLPYGNILSFKVGGILCQNCGKAPHYKGIKITPAQIKVLRLADQKDWHYFKRIKIAPENLKKLGWLVNFAIFYSLGKVPPSHKFIKPYLSIP